MEEEKRKFEAALSNIKGTEYKIRFILKSRNLASLRLNPFLDKKLESLYIQHLQENTKNPQNSVRFYAGLGKGEALKIVEVFRRSMPSMSSRILEEIGNYSGARKIWFDLKQPRMAAEVYERQAQREKGYKRKKLFLKAAGIWSELGEGEKAGKAYFNAGWLEYLKSKLK